MDYDALVIATGCAYPPCELIPTKLQIKADASTDLADLSAANEIAVVGTGLLQMLIPLIRTELSLTQFNKPTQFSSTQLNSTPLCQLWPPRFLANLPPGLQAAAIAAQLRSKLVAAGLGEKRVTLVSDQALFLSGSPSGDPSFLFSSHLFLQ